jgi:hypothetical protein
MLSHRNSRRNDLTFPYPRLVCKAAIQPQRVWIWGFRTALLQCSRSKGLWLHQSQELAHKCSMTATANSETNEQEIGPVGQICHWPVAGGESCTGVPSTLVNLKPVKSSAKVFTRSCKNPPPRHGVPFPACPAGLSSLSLFRIIRHSPFKVLNFHKTLSAGALGSTPCPLQYPVLDVPLRLALRVGLPESSPKRAGSTSSKR